MYSTNIPGIPRTRLITIFIILFLLIIFNILRNILTNCVTIIFMKSGSCNILVTIRIGESWGMANDGEWRTGQYLVEGVKVIKCFQARMLTPPMAGVNTN